MEGSARFVVVLLLRHRLAVGVFRDLEHIDRSVVVKFHGQRIRREDVVGDVTAPLSSDVFICGRVGDVCHQYPARK